MDTFTRILMLGIGATLCVDAWAALRRALLGVAPPDYAHLGRWLGHMAAGRLRHASIAAAAPLPGERALGWIAHYLIGIVFAAALVGLLGTGWLARPTVAPALGFGLLTVAAPFFLMQPGMGAGIAASKAPRPAVARLHSLLTHAIFGLGLYASALAFV